MFKLFRFIYICSVFLVIAFCSAKEATAAKLSAKPIDASDSTVIGVFLDTQDETINAVDGVVVLTDNNGDHFKISELSIGGSDFSLWPRTPSFSSIDKSISFVTGAPGGIAGEHLLLFKIIASFDQSGELTISPGRLTAYLNDGNASTRTITTGVSKIPVGVTPAENSSWDTIIANDRTAPAPFTITLGQDPSVNDGKKFITFNAIDADSGIDYYEVKEGDLAAVRTGITYVLVDQDGNDPITVTAYDKAGNAQVIVFKQTHTTTIIVVLIALIAFVYIIRKRPWWYKKI